MTKEEIEAVKEYVTALVEYQLAQLEEGEDGYRRSCVDERKRVEAAEVRLDALEEKP